MASTGSATNAPTQRRSSIIALRNRNFRFLFLSSISTGYGQWGQTIGMGWLVYQLTHHSATQLASVSAAGGFTTLLIGPFIGVALDRWHRRTIVMWSTWFSGLQAGLLAVLVLLGLVHVWQVYVFAVVAAVLSAINQQARQTFVYDITSDDTMVNAVALNSIGQNIARITGPPLTGAIIGVWGTPGPFIFIGVMMTIGTILTMPISRDTRQAARISGNPLRNLVDGFAYILHDRTMLGLMLMSVIPALLIYPYVPLLPVFAAKALNGSSGTYGLLAAALGLGSLVGLLGLAAVGDVRRKGLVMMVGLLVYTAFLLGFSQAHHTMFALVMLTAAGLFHGVALAMTQTLGQILPPNEMRGRTTGAIQTAFALMPIGALPMGVAVDRWGPQHGVGAFFAGAFVLFSLMLLFWRSLRKV